MKGKLASALLLFSNAAVGALRPTPVLAPRPTPMPPTVPQPTPVRIDITNYKQHLCDDSLFTPTPMPPSYTSAPSVPPSQRYYYSQGELVPLIPPPTTQPTSPTIPPIRDDQDSSRRKAIGDYYSVYCSSRSQYDEALKRKKENPHSDKEPCADLGDLDKISPQDSWIIENNNKTQDSCIATSGVGLANSCEIVRGAKRNLDSLNYETTLSRRYSWNAAMKTLKSCNTSASNSTVHNSTESNKAENPTNGSARRLR